jgi:hypothetical protein
MNLSAGDDALFLQTILDAMPCMVFAVDGDARIYHMNAAASRFLGSDIEKERLRRGGDTLRCVNSCESPEGCGRADICRSCLVRSSVREAMGGSRVHRRPAAMKLSSDGRISDMSFLVSASPFTFRGETLVLLMLEDVGELVALRRCLPICANCKKIRNDGNYWESVEQYLSARHDLDFTHSICPECRQELYPGLGKR